MLVPFPQFLLLRAASEQRRVAKALRTLADRATVWQKTIEQSCLEAREMVGDSLEATRARAEESRQERKRVAAVLERGDLTELMAERDRLQSKAERKR